MSTTYEFRALTSDGKIQEGMTQAESWDDAFRRVTASGLTPVKICTATRKSWRRRARRRVSLREVSQFTFQFSVLMEARIPVSEGLYSIAEEEPNETFREIISEMATSIAAGNRITEAMEPFRNIFGDVYIETVNAAEQSGNLQHVLAHLAGMLERDVERRSSMRSAMMYPICVVGALVLAVGFLMVFVVPRFVTMFGSRGIELPLPTRALLGMSQCVTGYWWVFVGLGGVGFFVWRHFASSIQGRVIIDRCLHQIPIVRRALQAAAMARFAHVLGLSLSSGLSLIDCLVMSGRASGRAMLIADTQRMAGHVSEGGRLSDVIKTCPYIPGFARRLISAGEQTAELVSMCVIIARHYDREVKYLTKNMATIIEPVVVVLLAVVVLFVALAIFLPMWSSMALMG